MEFIYHTLLYRLAEKAGVVFKQGQENNTTFTQHLNRNFSKSELTEISIKVNSDMHELDSNQMSILNRGGMLITYYDPEADVELRNNEIIKMIVILRIYNESNPDIRKKTVKSLLDLSNDERNDAVKDWNDFQNNVLQDVRRKLNIPDVKNDIDGENTHDSEKYANIAGDYLCIRASTGGEWIHFYPLRIEKGGGVTKKKLQTKKLSDTQKMSKQLNVRGNVIDTIDEDKWFAIKLFDIELSPGSHKDLGSPCYYVFEKGLSETDYRGFQLGAGFSDNPQSSAKRCRLRRITAIIDDKENIISDDSDMKVHELAPFNLRVNATGFRELPLNMENHFMPFRLGGNYDNVMSFFDARIANIDDLKPPAIKLGDVFFNAAAYIFEHKKDRTTMDNIEIVNLLIKSAEHASAYDFEDNRANYQDGYKRRIAMCNDVIKLFNQQESRKYKKLIENLKKSYGIGINTKIKFTWDKKKNIEFDKLANANPNLSQLVEHLKNSFR